MNKINRFLIKAIEKLPLLNRESLINMTSSTLHEKATLFSWLDVLPLGMVVYLHEQKYYSNSLFEKFLQEIPGLLLDEKNCGIIHFVDFHKKERLFHIQYVSHKSFSIFYLDDISEKYENIMNLKTQEGLDALEKLAAGIAHEIKNPLTAIDLHTQYIQCQIKKSSFQKIEEKIIFYVDIVKKESDRLLHILDTFLNMARKTKPIFLFTETSDTVKSVLDIFSEEFSKHNIKVDFHIDPVPKIFTSETILQQILSDLIRNAIEAMENVQKKHLYVSVKKDVTMRFVIICIGDSGGGISEKIRHSVFNPYFTTKKDGIGLGLTFVKKMIMEIGGGISIKESSHKGAEFQIYLPLSRGQKALISQTS